MNFTVRVIPGATAAQQTSENAIPMIDQNPPVNPTGPPGVGYVIFRTYIPSGGNTAVQLPAITVTHNGHSTTLPRARHLQRSTSPPWRTCSQP